MLVFKQLFTFFKVRYSIASSSQDPGFKSGCCHWYSWVKVEKTIFFRHFIPECRWQQLDSTQIFRMIRQVFYYCATWKKFV